MWKRIMSLRALIRVGYLEPTPYVKIMRSDSTLMKLECLRVIGFLREKSVLSELIDLAHNIDSVVVESLDFYYFPMAKEVLRNAGVLDARRNFELEEIITSIGYIDEPLGLTLIEETLASPSTFQELSFNLLIACIEALARMSDANTLILLTAIKSKLPQLMYNPTFVNIAIKSAFDKKGRGGRQEDPYGNSISSKDPYYNLVLEREKDDFNVAYPKSSKSRKLGTSIYWFRENMSEPLSEFQKQFPDVRLISSHFHNSPPDLTIPGPWRKHPLLQNKFHPDFHDDVQVMVHDGGPRFTDTHPEVVWVTVTAAEGNVFRGRIINNPYQLHTVKEGDEILFIVPEGDNYPILITERYLEDRSNWVIRPCNKCGLTELFDTPSDLLKIMFPDMPNTEHNCVIFSTFCGACGGMLVVHSAEITEDKVNEIINCRDQTHTVNMGRVEH